MFIKNILVAGPYEEHFLKQLPVELKLNFRFRLIDEISDEDLRWADVYVGSQPCEKFHFTNIKWVHSFNAGVNNYLKHPGWEENQVLLTRTICTFGERISEYCLSYMLQELQYHDFFSKNQKDKNWSKRTPKMIKDQTVVIYGTGEIGQVVAKTLRHFGAKVYGVSQTGAQKEFFHKVVVTSEAYPLIEKADWVISTLPLTKETNGIFHNRFFAHLNGANFINVGRGHLVNEDALIDALNQGKVQHAVLDVFPTEPLPRDSVLWEREDITITPHISAVTELDEAISCFLDTLEKVMKNEELSNQVDFSKGY